MNKTTIILGIAIFMLLICVGCATIISGTTQTITINSNVPGADVRLDGVTIGTTPFIGKIKRKSSSANITVSHPDYEPQSVYLISGVNIAWLGNFLLGGTTGTTTDIASGAFYQYYPDSYYAQLVPLQKGSLGFQEETIIRAFAMINHSQIAIDANVENGEYLIALADLMQSKMERALAIEMIKTALDASKGDQLTFGNELINSFQGYN